MQANSRLSRVGGSWTPKIGKTMAVLKAIILHTFGGQVGCGVWGLRFRACVEYNRVSYLCW